MRSNKKNRLASIDAARVTPAKGGGAAAVGWAASLGQLKLQRSKIKSADITFIFRNLSTLIENGVSLPKSLGALADERGMEGARTVLTTLRQALESGATFSAALAGHPETFDTMTVNQVKVGERAGALGEALVKIAEQREKAGKLRGQIIKKLSYPAILTLFGTAVIAFLLAYVVPTFEQTYTQSGVPLPDITQALILVGSIARNYWMLFLGALAVGALLFKQLRSNEPIARWMDARLLEAPLIGQWLRDIAVLNMMEVVGNLLEAGFNLSDALGEAVNAIGNREIRACAADLRQAVNRGERFSREVENHSKLFPPLVSQLVIVGEQTGNLAKATRHIRVHLHDEIERRSNVFVGTIEPVLTISMAFAVALILLAIYLPMFDMISTMGV